MTVLQSKYSMTALLKMKLSQLSHGSQRHIMICDQILQNRSKSHIRQNQTNTTSG